MQIAQADLREVTTTKLVNVVDGVRMSNGRLKLRGIANTMND